MYFSHKNFTIESQIISIDIPGCSYPVSVNLSYVECRDNTPSFVQISPKNVCVVKDKPFEKYRNYGTRCLNPLCINRSFDDCHDTTTKFDTISQSASADNSFNLLDLFLWIPYCASGAILIALNNAL